jgi:hypothetical protein
MFTFLKIWQAISKLWNKLVESEWWVIVVCGSFSWWLMSHTFSSTAGELHIATKAWSDFAAHIPLIRSFSFGNNWPPEYPLFAGEPIKYHFLFYALVGLAEHVGINIALALNGLSALGMTLMLWMIYRTTKLIFASHQAGWLAIFLTLTNGSLSLLALAEKAHLSWEKITDWPALVVTAITSTQFASFGPWDGGLVSAFWTLNIFTNQRHLAASLGLVWWILWPLLLLWWQPEYNLKKTLTLRTKLGMGVRTVLLAIFPLLHQAGWLIVGWFSVALLIGSLIKKTQRQRLTWKLVLPYACGLLFSVVVAILFVPSSHGQLPMQFGFLTHEPTLIGIAQYWWFNLGLYCMVWAVSLFWRSPIRRLVWLATPLFFAANVWRFSPDMINNHKLVNFFLQTLSMAAAGGLVWSWSYLKRIWHHKNWRAWQKILWLNIVAGTVMVFFVGLTISGVIDFFPILNDRKITIQDWQKQPVSVWLKENTAQDAAFVTTTYLYHPASLVGRKLFLDYGYFDWSLGYDDRTRRESLPVLFGEFDSIAGWCQTMQGQKLAGVILSPGQGELGPTVPVQTSFVVTQLSPTAVTSDGARIYVTAEFCQ